MAAQMPWPSEPVATSTNGSRGVGALRDLSRSGAASAAGAIERCLGPRGTERRGVPFDSTKRSLAGFSTFDRSAARRRTARREPAIDAAGRCPLPASDVARTESMRSRWRCRRVESATRSMDMDRKFYFRRSASARAQPRLPTRRRRARVPIRPPGCARPGVIIGAAASPPRRDRRIVQRRERHSTRAASQRIDRRGRLAIAISSSASIEHGRRR